jgi:ATPase subunit of ABC transporter with duplicated ATPase domains
MYQRAVNVEKRIEHIDKVDKPTSEYKSMNLRLSSTKKAGREIIRIESLKKAFGDKQLFNSIDILIRNGEKVVISGENGSGKSTIINLLTGSLQPDSGKAVIGSGASCGLLPQEITFEDPNRPILEEVRHMLRTNAHTAQRLLASFGFKGEHVMKRVSELSGGEQKRLRLCTLMQHDHTLLIMDEPTNHMDIASREIIEDAVIKFSGTCLFVSHDRYFIKKVCTRSLLLDNGILMEYEGDYSTLFDASRHQAKKKAPAKRESRRNGPSKNNIRELAKIEGDIHSVETRIDELNKNMQKPLRYDELSKMLGEKNRLEQQLSKLYELWDKKS